MKKITYLLLVSLFAVLKGIAQVPQGTSYQGVAKDKEGKIVANQLVAVRISIMDNSEKGKAVYQETFNNLNTPENAVLTDENGVYSLTIGQGTPEEGQFSEINWGLNSKFFKVEIDTENEGKGTNYIEVGATQLMSVPYALFAQNAQALAGGSMTVVETINDLRYVNCEDATTVYVKGYHAAGDGGGGIFVWKEDFEKLSGGRYKSNYRTCAQMKICEDTDGSYYDSATDDGDNGGTIIKSYQSHCKGKWLRQYENYINIKFFGVMSMGDNCSCELQKAIDFAEINSKDDPYLKGSAIYIPNGSYFLDNGIILKDGVGLLGESIGRTLFYSTGKCISQFKSLFSIEEGAVMLNIENFCFLGQQNNTKTTCFNFEAFHNVPGNGNNADPMEHGGLWNSTIKNIIIKDFKGDGIALIGGGFEDYLIPNQFTVFENVRVFRGSDENPSLRMEGQAGQISFINCQFDGFKRNGTYAHNPNVIIKNKGYQTSNVVSFLNSTFQDSDYGVYVDYSDGLTFDTCWFENLGVSINIDGSQGFSSAAVNVLNNRFANAAGFGSLDVNSSNITAGMCVKVKNGLVNITNNTVTTSYDKNIDDDAFVLAEVNNLGVNLSGNAFRFKKLGRTYGVLQYVPITSIGGIPSIDCKNNRLIFVNTSGQIDRIESGLNAGERISIRAENGPISFSHFNNIFLINTQPFTTGDFVTLQQGEMAVFIKIDNSDMNGLGLTETYQMESIIRVSTPQN